ncbi:hypothetical protein ACJ72_06884 [Emergomyces africanus]|uniref:Restriction of telomere capping protein 4 C-terminal domain-containing protein n=1 Tax=Emergomyces africanus TaxID=1955775 RepID=A0A1B7NPQ3_9EURO|nr:hypothetical protein ACJ72_06884 [Emergomyces africanus]
MLLKASHYYLDKQLQPADDLVILNLKPHTLSLFSTVITMCSLQFCENIEGRLHDTSDCDVAILSLCETVLMIAWLNFILACAVFLMIPDTALSHEILSEHVVRHFARDIDALAGIDSVVSKYDTVVYAQEVLVLELLEMLVQENMKVDVKGARQILKESNKIGDLLNCE